MNAVLLPAAAKEVWTEAERIGLLILAKTIEPNAAFVQSSPACLGWVVPTSALVDWAKWKEWASSAQKVRQLVGIELETMPAQPLPAEIRFVVGPDILPPLPQRPRLMRSLFEQATTDAELGWLDDSRSLL